MKPLPEENSHHLPAELVKLFFPDGYGRRVRTVVIKKFTDLLYRSFEERIHGRNKQ
jgi:hypothetical protein